MRLAVVAICIVVLQAHALNVPFFAWSGQEGVLSAGHQVVSKSLDLENEFKHSLRRLLAGTTEVHGLSSYFAQSGTPEVVVVFLEPQLRTDTISDNQEAFGPLHRIIEESAASVSIPWAEANTHSSFDDFLLEASVLSSVFVLNPDDSRTSVSLLNSVRVKAVTLKELKNQKIFRDKLPQLVVVLLSGHYAADGLTIANVNAAVAEKTSDYVAIFTAQAAEDPQIPSEWSESGSHISKVGQHHVYYHYSFESLSLASNGSNCTNCNCTTNCTADPSGEFLYWFPPWFWEGLLFGVIFVWIVICGACVLMEIQTPDRYLKETSLKLGS